MVKRSIDRQDFDALPVFADRGGLRRANAAFGGELQPPLSRLNRAVAARPRVILERAS